MMILCAAQKNVKDKFSLNEVQMQSLLGIDSVTRRIGSILKEDGFLFDLAAVGGCIRDSVGMPNPDIKDIDLLFYPIQFPAPKQIKDLNNLIATTQEYDAEELSGLYKKKINSFCDKLLKEFQVVKILEPTEEDYSSPHIESILRIEDASLFKPIDLIFSKNLNISDFVDECYDFEICKVLLKPLQNNGEFILNYSFDFKKDLDEKRITFSNSSFDEVELSNSLNNHYVRIKEKYPEHKLVYDKHYVQFTKNIKTILDYHMLNEYVDSNSLLPKKSFKI